MKENRTKVIRARLSEEEKEQVFRRAKAEGVTLSMYLRKYVNSLPVDENIRLSLESIEMYIKELKQITDKLI